MAVRSGWGGVVAPDGVSVAGATFSRTTQPLPTTRSPKIDPSARLTGVAITIYPELFDCDADPREANYAVALFGAVAGALRRTPEAWPVLLLHNPTVHEDRTKCAVSVLVRQARHALGSTIYGHGGSRFILRDIDVVEKVITILDVLSKL